MREQNRLSDEWYRLTIYRLILVCEAVSAKYTRSRVRKRTPKDMVYILDELLNVTDDVVKEYYYDEIISTILDTGIAEHFIKSICELIQSLAIDSLHIIGDIYDRGPRADIIMDELMTVLANSFMHSERLNAHIRFLCSKGSMYKTINGNLLFHGCIPLDENGQLQSVNIAGKQYSGKAMLSFIVHLFIVQQIVTVKKVWFAKYHRLTLLFIWNVKKC